LHEQLARDPAFFAELLELAYQDQEGGSGEAAEVDVNQATAAHSVLDSLRTLPGQTGGDVDTTALDSWVGSVLERSDAVGRLGEGAAHVGKLLSHSPVGTDGAWPHEAVRRVLEKYENSKMEEGFEDGKFNQRGVVMRGWEEGGTLEGEIADQYSRWAAQVRPQWPRTAAILRRLERIYRSQASREDDQTDLRLDGVR
jgi:hypothetical protein